MDESLRPAYPACCPKCQEERGWPFSAGTCDRPGVIVVKLRCGTCHHEWTADAPKAQAAVVGFWPGRRARQGYRTA